MKTILKVAILSAIFGIATLFTLNGNSLDSSELAEANVLFMTTAIAEGGTGHTGPGQIEDCAGPWTGQRKFCMSSNEYVCTPETCG